MAIQRDICGLNFDLMVEVGKMVEANRKAETIAYWADLRKQYAKAHRAWLDLPASADQTPMEIEMSDMVDNHKFKLYLNMEIRKEFMDFFDARAQLNLTIKGTKEKIEADKKVEARAQRRRQRANERRYASVRAEAIARGWNPRPTTLPRCME